MHILSFNPYVRWNLHSARQAAILHGLHLRGADILHVLCDGLMSECDLHQTSRGPSYERTALSCTKCQAQSAYLAARNKLNFLWLGRWLDPKHLSEAYEWAYDTPNPESAVFRDWPIGEWVKSSVLSHHRSEHLDLSNPDVSSLYKRYLASGAVIAIGLDTLLKQEQPDAQLLFNGRMAPTRIALELAKQHGVRTFTEERGFAPGHMRLVVDTHCLDPNPFYELWQMWKNTPLLDSELKDLEDLLTSHLAGREYEMPLFAAPTKGSETVRDRLDLNSTHMLVSLFTSSTDESQSQPEAVGSFPSQQSWVRATIDLAKNNPSIQLVIRTHPNIGGKRAVGNNTEEIAFIGSLSADLPNNVQLILPEDDISSFDLMAASDCGLIWHSSLGVEMAAMGKPVLRAGAYWFRDADFMTSCSAPESYETAFTNTVAESQRPPSIENTIRAWRFAYCWFFRQSLAFPLVKQPDWAHGEPAYASLEELAPGRDTALDQICSMIMNDTPILSQAEKRPLDIVDNEKAAVARYIERFT